MTFLFSNYYMTFSNLHNKKNLLLIAGTGRNVGKTILACEIIHILSKTTKVIGVKISHHFHSVEEGQKVIANTQDYLIIEESLITSKDSSRMKQAGANKVFYIQARQENLLKAFNIVSDEIDNSLVICESGGLHRYIKPGVFLLVKGNEIPEDKKPLLSFNPIIVSYINGISNINITNIHFQDNCFTFNLNPDDKV